MPDNWSQSCLMVCEAYFNDLVIPKSKILLLFYLMVVLLQGIANL